MSANGGVPRATNHWEVLMRSVRVVGGCIRGGRQLQMTTWSCESTGDRGPRGGGLGRPSDLPSPSVGVSSSIPAPPSVAATTCTGCALAILLRSSGFGKWGGALSLSIGAAHVVSPPPRSSALHPANACSSCSPPTPLAWPEHHRRDQRKHGEDTVPSLLSARSHAVVVSHVLQRWHRLCHIHRR